MPRATLSLLLVFAATVPVKASAQDCMCLSSGQLRASWDSPAPNSPFGTGPVEVSLPQSIEVGPVFSSDGESLVSDEPRDEMQPAERAEAPTAPVLWCASADDPRCAPRDEAPGDGPQTFEASHGASAAAEPPTFAEPGGRDHAHASAFGAPRAGVRSRVDRPPQA